MQKSAILQMFYGERGDSQVVPMSDSVQKAAERLADWDDELSAKLKDFPEALSLYKKVCEAFDDEHVEAIDCYYREGFRFGFLMALDVMGWKKE